MAIYVYLTRDRITDLEQELREKKTKGRHDMAAAIAYARSHGDLSENADYDAAKEAQGHLEMRISKLETMLANARIVDPSDYPADKVYILSYVQLKNKKNNSFIEYLMVSPEESDFEQNKMSVTSPIGKSLMGKAVGEHISVRVPAGIMEYEIIKIWR